MTEKQKNSNKMSLPLGTTVAYGSGMFSFGFQLTITGYYLMYFMTDILVLPTILAASLNTAIQWAKIFLMLLAGVIVDANHIKGGKFRPWIMVGCIGLFIFFPLSFTSFGLPTLPGVILFMTFYMGMILSYNIGWTAIRSIVGPMSKNNADALGLTLASTIGGAMASVVFGFVSEPIFNISLWAGTANRFAGASFVYGCIILVCGFIMLKTCKKYDNDDINLTGIVSDTAEKKKAEKLTFKEMLSNLSGPMIPYFVSSTVKAAQSGFYSTLLAYFTKFVLNNPSLVATTLSITSVVSVATSFIAVPLALKFGKKRVNIISTLASAAFFVLMYYYGTTVFMFLFLRVMLTFVSGFGGMLGYAFINDIADYKEMMGTPPARAFLQSIGGTATRVGQAVSVAIASFGLAAIGYSAGVEVTAEMGVKITSLMCWPPAILSLIAGIIFFWYNVDEKQLDVYRAQKAAKVEEAKSTL